MQLKDFVSKTLLEISEGIVEAQKAGADYGLIVAPPVGKDGLIAESEGHEAKPHAVNFNLKLCVEEKSGKGKQGGEVSLSIAMVSLSAKTGDQSQEHSGSSQIQEISFEIPVIWPTNYVRKSLPLPDRSHGPYDPFLQRG